MADTSVAYDIARFEEREERAQLRREQPRVVTESRPSMWGTVIKFMLLAAVAAGSLGMLLSSNAQITDIHSEITKEQNKLADLEQENRRMIAAIEEKSSQKTVEEYVENVLGMKKLDRSQIEYITLDSANVAQITEKDDNIFKEIARYFEGLSEKAKDRENERN